VSLKNTLRRLSDARTSSLKNTLLRLSDTRTSSLDKTLRRLSVNARTPHRRLSDARSWSSCSEFCAHPVNEDTLRPSPTPKRRAHLVTRFGEVRRLSDARTLSLDNTLCYNNARDIRESADEALAAHLVARLHSATPKRRAHPVNEDTL